MNKRTIKFNTPSLYVNRDFLETLGKILESQIKRKEASLSPREYATYSINSQNEDLSFTSMHDLLQTEIFPKSISSMAFRITPYDEGYVTIFIEFNNNIVSGSNVMLISSNEERILKIEHDLKQLFERYETRYSWIYKVYNNNFLVLMVSVLIFAFILDGAVLMFIHKFIVKIPANNFILYFWILGIPLEFLLILAHEKFLPKYIFDVQKHKLLRYTIIAIIGGILINALYDLIKYMLSSTK